MVWLFVVAALLCLVAAIVGLLRVPTSGRFPVRTWLTCGTVWLLMLVTTEVFEALLRARVREVAATVSSAEPVVAEGIHLRDPAVVAAALRDIKRAWPHHSGPSRCTTVILSPGQDALRLRLCQDSRDQTEYWVFDPEFRYSAMNEIGRVVIRMPL